MINYQDMQLTPVLSKSSHCKLGYGCVVPVAPATTMFPNSYQKCGLRWTDYI